MLTFSLQSAPEKAPVEQLEMSEPKKERTKPIEWATFGVVLVATIGGAWKFYLLGESQTAALNRREKEIAVSKAEGESVSLEAQVLSPELLFVTSERSVPIRPVYVYINNTGQVPVDLEELEFRVFWASLDDAIIHTVLETPESDKAVVPATQDSVGVVYDEPGALIGMIDPDSADWVEIEKLRQTIKLKDMHVAPGQSCVERRHLVASTGGSRLLTKVEVTLRTSKTSRRWYGFITEPAMCLPTPFPSTATEGIEAAPAPEPPN